MRQSAHSTTAARPEHEALLLCARADWDDEAAHALAGALSRVGDGQALVDLAIRHGMLGLLAARAVEAAPHGCPAGLIERLTPLGRTSAHRNLRLAGQLFRVLDALREAAVPAVPFKGPLLAQTAYGDVALRHFADLDLLVESHSVADARRILLDLGYRVIASQRDVADRRLLDGECELVFEADDGRVDVELHWRVGPRFAGAAVAAEPLIARAEPVDLLGRQVSSLRADDLFVVLCVHGAAHRWDALELIAAVARTIDGFGGEWPPALARARSFACLRRCLIGALLARDVAGASLPAPLERAAERDAGAVRLAHRARVALFTRPPSRTPGGGLEGLLWQAQAMDTPSARVRHLASRVLTPGARDWRVIAIPPRLSGLYYVVRPLRLAAQHRRRGR